MPVAILHEHIKDFERTYKRMMQKQDMNYGVVTLQYRRSPDGHETEAKRFVGLREAVHRNARQQLGRLVPFTRRLGFDWTSKRVPYFGLHDDSGPLWTLPKSVDDPISQPYLPVAQFGQYVPEYLDEQSILDMLNDSPE